MPGFGSPRIQITEKDISEFVSGIPTSVGVLIVRGRRGGFDPVFISSTRDLKWKFCKNRKLLDSDLVELYVAKAFLENRYAGLWVERAINRSSTGACILVNASRSSSPTTVIAGGLTINTDKSDYVYPDWSALTDDVNGIYPLFLLYAKSPGSMGNNFRVLISSVSGTDKTFNLVIEEVLPDKEIITILDQKVSLNPEAKDGYGNSIYLGEVLARNEDVGVKINMAEVNAGSLPSQIITSVSFEGGSDVEAVAGDLGDELNKFGSKEQYDIDLLIQGGIGGDIWRTALVSLAESRGDCFAVLDVDESNYTVDKIRDWRVNSFRVSSSYGAVFAPWLKIYDFDWDRDMFIPPSGVVAGMMARCDYEYDPWWVPAGLSRGAVKVLGLKCYYSLSERDELDKLQVNCFVRKPGVIALWNNRTLQTTESAFSFIETRRLLNYIKKNVCRILDQFLFEPLVDFTRLRLVGLLDEFLRTIKQRFGLYDYSVVSDSLGTGNNPANQIDQGILTVEIYLKPVRAVRHIWLRAIVTRTGYSLEERMV